MSGASIGLADTFIASLGNPAGLAMAVGIGDDNISSSTSYDQEIQAGGQPLDLNGLGFALGLRPWAFSFGYVNPYREDASYSTAAAPADPDQIDVSTGEFHLSAARSFLDDHLSLGVGLVLGEADRTMTYQTNTDLDASERSYAFGAGLGALFRFPHRLLLGASLQLPMTYSATDTGAAATPGLPGFLQPVKVPTTVGFGLGWVPNSYLRADLSVLGVGTTTGAALLSDQAISVGQTGTLQPRVGAAYVFADYSEVSATLFLGSYYEWTRVEGARSRIHGTAGIEVKPWIFTLGWGFDSSAGYSSTLVSVGVDVFKTLAKLDLIPVPWRPPHAGLFPQPFRESDEGLPRSLSEHWVSRGPEINPLQVAAGLPAKVGQKLQQLQSSVWNFLGLQQKNAAAPPRPSPSPAPPDSAKSGNEKSGPS